MNFFYRLSDFFYFLFLSKDYKKIVIYSEGINYKNYFNDFIKVLITKHNLKLAYISSDKNDFIDHKNVKNIYIGKSYLRTILFSTLNCKNLILTLTDIGNSYIKKSKLCERYIYIFHSALSTHVAYNKKAFWNYDIIFCNGEYQYNELKESEKKYNLNKKILLKTGYLYFDFLRKKNFKPQTKKTNVIILAPTWINKTNNFFEDYSYQIIDKLLLKNFKVILRPHPEHFKISKKTIKKIKTKFENNNNFYFEENINDFSNLEKSDLMITDYSGASIEYLFIFKKPVIFINSSQKVNNPDHTDLNVEQIEKKIREEFGYQIETKDIDKISDLVQTAARQGVPKKKEDIEIFLRQNFYNENKVADYIADYLIENCYKK